MKKIIGMLLICAVIAFAAKAYNGQAATGRNFEILRHNINQVEMCVSNYGKFGQDETGNNPGLWWPAGTPYHTYIYGAGSWFGTLDETGDSLVTIGYGPGGGESEYAPGLEGWSVSDPDAIIWMQGTANWPPNPERLPMAPTRNLSHQDSWCVYNDFDAQYHMLGDTRPIGLEVYQTVYAWNLSTTQDIIFVRYELKNASGGTLTDCYFGVCTDNDIGDEGAQANDRISGIVGQWYVIDGDSTWIDNLGYQWQEDEEPGTPPWFPGTIGFDYLQSPYRLEAGENRDNDSIPDEYEQDSAYYVNNWPSEFWDVDNDGTPDWRDPSENPQWGMTAFKRFTLGVEPTYDRERYLTLAGYNFRTLVREPYDTVPPAPDDQRFLQCSGPFTLEAEETAVVLVGIVLAEWHDIYARPDTALVGVDGTAQFIYDQNWLLPGPPPPPTVTLLPGDTRVTLTWDNTAETAIDPYWEVVGTNPLSPLYDPYYQAIDFQGYRVWKSISGRAGTWELLDACDLADGVVFEDTTQPDSIRLRAEDTGIFHAFTDNDVRNGFVYYYAVTSFDWNQVKTISGPDTFPSPIWFESGLTGDSTRPRRDPANYVPPGEPLIEYLSGNNQITELVSASVALPLDIDANRPLYIEYLASDTVTMFYIDANYNEIPYTGARYTALLKDDAGVLDTISYALTIGDGYVPYEVVPPVNGLFINPNIGTPELPSPFAPFDSIERVSGDYPLDFLVPDVGVPLPAATDSSDTVYMHGMWAWRGNDYQVVWRSKNPGGPVNTVEVTDLATGEVIPYLQFQNNPATRYLGSCWCFSRHNPQTTWNNPSHDTLQLVGFTPATKTRYLYINGGMIALNNNGPMVDTIVPSDGETWIVRANRDYLPPSVFGEVRITCTPGVFLADTTLDLNVKVVPNPYVIANEWQTRFLERRLKFINLPNHCTIRIFNLNGELVRTLIHNETSEDGVTNNLGGDEWWNVLSDNDQLVASGVYIFHVSSDVGEQVGKFVVIR
jgi:hypothetical protein